MMLSPGKIDNSLWISVFAAGLTARLRGFPLKGSRMKVPEGYSGVVLKEAQAVEAGDGGRVVRGVARFDTFTFWNWDRQPSRSDKYQQALDWLEVASVVSGDQIGLWCVWVWVCVEGGGAIFPIDQRLLCPGVWKEIYMQLG